MSKKDKVTTPVCHNEHAKKKDKHISAVCCPVFRSNEKMTVTAAVVY